MIVQGAAASPLSSGDGGSHQPLLFSFSGKTYCARVQSESPPFSPVPEAARSGEVAFISATAAREAFAASFARANPSARPMPTKVIRLFVDGVEVEGSDIKVARDRVSRPRFHKSSSCPD